MFSRRLMPNSTDSWNTIAICERSDSASGSAGLPVDPDRTARRSMTGDQRQECALAGARFAADHGDRAGGHGERDVVQRHVAARVLHRDVIQLDRAGDTAAVDRVGASVTVTGVSSTSSTRSPQADALALLAAIFASWRTGLNSVR